MNISFALTTPQFKARTKTVTRRNGWENVKAGQVLEGVEKGQGIKKGEKVVRIGPIKVINARREMLKLMTVDLAYGRTEVIKEGFPNLSPQQFVTMYCNHNHCTPEKIVSRIEFEYL